MWLRFLTIYLSVYMLFPPVVWADLIQNAQQPSVTESESEAETTEPETEPKTAAPDAPSQPAASPAKPAAGNTSPKPPPKPEPPKVDTRNNDDRFHVIRLFIEAANALRVLTETNNKQALHFAAADWTSDFLSYDHCESPFENPAEITVADFDEQYLKPAQEALSKYFEGRQTELGSGEGIIGAWDDTNVVAHYEHLYNGKKDQCIPMIYRWEPQKDSHTVFENSITQQLQLIRLQASAIFNPKAIYLMTRGPDPEAVGKPGAYVYFPIDNSEVMRWLSWWSILRKFRNYLAFGEALENNKGAVLSKVEFDAAPELEFSPQVGKKLEEVLAAYVDYKATEQLENRNVGSALDVNENQLRVVKATEKKTRCQGQRLGSLRSTSDPRVICEAKGDYTLNLAQRSMIALDRDRKGHATFGKAFSLLAFNFLMEQKRQVGTFLTAEERGSSELQANSACFVNEDYRAIAIDYEGDPKDRESKSGSLGKYEKNVLMDGFRLQVFDAVEALSDEYQSGARVVPLPPEGVLPVGSGANALGVSGENDYWTTANAFLQRWVNHALSSMYALESGAAIQGNEVLKRFTNLVNIFPYQTRIQSGESFVEGTIVQGNDYRTILANKMVLAMIAGRDHLYETIDKNGSGEVTKQEIKKLLVPAAKFALAESLEAYVYGVYYHYQLDKLAGTLGSHLQKTWLNVYHPLWLSILENQYSAVVDKIADQMTADIVAKSELFNGETWDERLKGALQKRTEGLTETSLAAARAADTERYMQNHINDTGLKSALPGWLSFNSNIYDRLAAITDVGKAPACFQVPDKDGRIGMTLDLPEPTKPFGWSYIRRAIVQIAARQKDKLAHRLTLKILRDRVAADADFADALMVAFWEAEEPQREFVPFARRSKETLEIQAKRFKSSDKQKWALNRLAAITPEKDIPTQVQKLADQLVLHQTATENDTVSGKVAYIGTVEKLAEVLLERFAGTQKAMFSDDKQARISLYSKELNAVKSWLLRQEARKYFEDNALAKAGHIQSRNIDPVMKIRPKESGDAVSDENSLQVWRKLFAEIVERVSEREILFKSIDPDALEKALTDSDEDKRTLEGYLKDWAAVEAGLNNLYGVEVEPAKWAELLKADCATSDLCDKISKVINATHNKEQMRALFRARVLVGINGKLEKFESHFGAEGVAYEGLEGQKLSDQERDDIYFEYFYELFDKLFGAGAVEYEALARTDAKLKPSLAPIDSFYIRYSKWLRENKSASVENKQEQLRILVKAVASEFALFDPWYKMLMERVQKALAAFAEQKFEVALAEDIDWIIFLDGQHLTGNTGEEAARMLEAYSKGRTLARIILPTFSEVSSGILEDIDALLKPHREPIKELKETREELQVVKDGLYALPNQKEKMAKPNYARSERMLLERQSVIEKKVEDLEVLSRRYERLDRGLRYYFGGVRLVSSALAKMGLAVPDDEGNSIIHQKVKEGAPGEDPTLEPYWENYRKDHYLNAAVDAEGKPVTITGRDLLDDTKELGAKLFSYPKATVFDAVRFAHDVINYCEVAMRPQMRPHFDRMVELSFATKAKEERKDSETFCKELTEQAEHFSSQALLPAHWKVLAQEVPHLPPPTTVKDGEKKPLWERAVDLAKIRSVPSQWRSVLEYAARNSTLGEVELSAASNAKYWEMVFAVSSAVHSPLSQFQPLVDENGTVYWFSSPVIGIINVLFLGLGEEQKTKRILSFLNLKGLTLDHVKEWVKLANEKRPDLELPEPIQHIVPTWAQTMTDNALSYVQKTFIPDLQSPKQMSEKYAWLNSLNNEERGYLYQTLEEGFEEALFGSYAQGVPVMRTLIFGGDLAPKVVLPKAPAGNKTSQRGPPVGSAGEQAPPVNRDNVPILPEFAQDEKDIPILPEFAQDENEIPILPEFAQDPRDIPILPEFASEYAVGDENTPILPELAKEPVEEFVDGLKQFARISKEYVDKYGDKVPPPASWFQDPRLKAVAQSVVNANSSYVKMVADSKKALPVKKFEALEFELPFNSQGKSLSSKEYARRLGVYLGLWRDLRVSFARRFSDSSRGAGYAVQVLGSTIVALFRTYSKYAPYRAVWVERKNELREYRTGFYNYQYLLVEDLYAKFIQAVREEKKDLNRVFRGEQVAFESSFLGSPVRWDDEDVDAAGVLFFFRDQFLRAPSVEDGELWRRLYQAKGKEKDFLREPFESFVFDWSARGAKTKYAENFKSHMELLCAHPQMKTLWADLKKVKPTVRRRLWHRFDSCEEFQKSASNQQWVGLLELADKNAEAIGIENSYATWLLELNDLIHHQGENFVLDEKSRGLPQHYFSYLMGEVVDELGIDLRDFSSWKAVLYGYSTPRDWLDISHLLLTAAVGGEGRHLLNIETTTESVDPAWGTQHNYRYIPMIDSSERILYLPKDMTFEQWREKAYSPERKIYSQVSASGKDRVHTYDSYLPLDAQAFGERDRQTRLEWLKLPSGRVIELTRKRQAEEKLKIDPNDAVAAARKKEAEERLAVYLKDGTGDRPALVHSRMQEKNWNTRAFGAESIDPDLLKAMVREADTKKIENAQDKLEKIGKTWNAYQDFRHTMSEAIRRYPFEGMELRFVHDSSWRMPRLMLHREVAVALRSFATQLKFKAVDQLPHSISPEEAVWKASEIANLTQYGGKSPKEIEELKTLTQIMDRTYSAEVKALQLKGSAFFQAVENINRGAEKLCGGKDLTTLSSEEEVKEYLLNVEQAGMVFWDNFIKMAAELSPEGLSHPTRELMLEVARERMEKHREFQSMHEGITYVFFGVITLLIVGRLYPGLGSFVAGMMPKGPLMQVAGTGLILGMAGLFGYESWKDYQHHFVEYPAFLKALKQFRDTRVFAKDGLMTNERGFQIDALDVESVESQRGILTNMWRAWLYLIPISMAWSMGRAAIGMLPRILSRASVPGVAWMRMHFRVPIIPFMPKGAAPRLGISDVAAAAADPEALTIKSKIFEGVKRQLGIVKEVGDYRILSERGARDLNLVNEAVLKETCSKLGIRYDTLAEATIRDFYATGKLASPVKEAAEPWVVRLSRWASPKRAESALDAASDQRAHLRGQLAQALELRAQLNPKNGAAKPYVTDAQLSALENLDLRNLMTPWWWRWTGLPNPNPSRWFTRWRVGGVQKLYRAAQVIREEEGYNKLIKVVEKAQGRIQKDLQEIKRKEIERLGDRASDEAKKEIENLDTETVLQRMIDTRNPKNKLYQETIANEGVAEDATEKLGQDFKGPATETYDSEAALTAAQEEAMKARAKANFKELFDLSLELQSAVSQMGLQPSDFTVEMCRNLVQKSWWGRVKFRMAAGRISDSRGASLYGQGEEPDSTQILPDRDRDVFQLGPDQMVFVGGKPLIPSDVYQMSKSARLLSLSEKEMKALELGARRLLEAKGLSGDALDEQMVLVKKILEQRLNAQQLMKIQMRMGQSEIVDAFSHTDYVRVLEAYQTAIDVTADHVRSKALTETLATGGRVAIFPEGYQKMVDSLWEAPEEEGIWGWVKQMLASNQTSAALLQSRFEFVQKMSGQQKEAIEPVLRAFDYAIEQRFYMEMAVRLGGQDSQAVWGYWKYWKQLLKALAEGETEGAHAEILRALLEEEIATGVEADFRLLNLKSPSVSTKIDARADEIVGALRRSRDLPKPGRLSQNPMKVVEWSDRAIERVNAARNNTKKIPESFVGRREDPREVVRFSTSGDRKVSVTRAMQKQLEAEGLSGLELEARTLLGVGMRATSEEVKDRVLALEELYSQLRANKTITEETYQELLKRLEWAKQYLTWDITESRVFVRGEQVYPKLLDLELLPELKAAIVEILETQGGQNAADSLTLLYLTGVNQALVVQQIERLQAQGMQFTEKQIAKLLGTEEGTAMGRLMKAMLSLDEAQLNNVLTTLGRYSELARVSNLVWRAEQSGAIQKEEIEAIAEAMLKVHFNGKPNIVVRPHLADKMLREVRYDFEYESVVVHSRLGQYFNGNSTRHPANFLRQRAQGLHALLADPTRNPNFVRLEEIIALAENHPDFLRFLFTTQERGNVEYANYLIRVFKPSGGEAILGELLLNAPPIGLEASAMRAELMDLAYLAKIQNRTPSFEKFVRGLERLRETPENLAKVRDFKESVGTLSDENHSYYLDPTVVLRALKQKSSGGGDGAYPYLNR